MKAVIEVDVPEYQIGQEVSVYFKDTMCVKSVCNKKTSSNGALEIFGNLDCPSRSGTIISPETFIKGLKNSEPVPVTVKGNIVGYINSCCDSFKQKEENKDDNA